MIGFESLHSSLNHLLYYFQSPETSSLFMVRVFTARRITSCWRDARTTTTWRSSSSPWPAPGRSRQSWRTSGTTWATSAGRRTLTGQSRSQETVFITENIPERTGWAVWTSRARLTPWGLTHPSVASPCLIVSTLFIVLRMATPWLSTVNCKKWELQGKTWCHDWA